MRHIHLLLIVTIPILFMAVPSYAKTDINQTFDIKKLSASFALSCADQAALRHKSIPPAYFPGRPQAFSNDSESLVIYSSHLTRKQRQTAEKLIASLPPHIFSIAYQGGAVYVFTRRSIVEAVPALAVENTWFKDFGLYMSVERRLYFPFEKGEGVSQQRDGTYKAQRFVPSQREPFRIINHETGHMIDNLLGEYSLKSIGDDNNARLSNRADFRAALTSDLTRLTSPTSPLSKEEIQRLGYYMPYEFKGKILGGMHPTAQRAHREIFAELWAEVQGYDSNKLSRAYPDTFKIVKTINEFLKAQYDTAPASCPLP